MFLLLRRDTIIFSTTVFAKYYILRIVRLIPLKLNQKGKMIHKSRAGFCFLCLLMLLAVFQSYVYEMTQKNICFICHNIFQIINLLPVINAWLQVIFAAILFSDINKLFALSCLLKTDLFGEIIKLH